jgi:hypothetical protein
MERRGLRIALTDSGRIHLRDLEGNDLSHDRLRVRLLLGSGPGMGTQYSSEEHVRNLRRLSYLGTYRARARTQILSAG